MNSHEESLAKEEPLSEEKSSENDEKKSCSPRNSVQNHVGEKFYRPLFDGFVNI